MSYIRTMDALCLVQRQVLSECCRRLSFLRFLHLCSGNTFLKKRMTIERVDDKHFRNFLNRYAIPSRRRIRQLTNAHGAPPSNASTCCRIQGSVARFAPLRIARKPMRARLQVLDLQKGEVIDGSVSMPPPPQIPDGEIDAATAAEIHAHLASCAHLSAKLNELQSQQDVVNSQATLVAT